MELAKQESPSRLLSKCWKVQWNDSHRHGRCRLSPPLLLSITFVGTAWHSSKLKRKWVGVSANQIVSTTCKSWIQNSTSSSSSPYLVFLFLLLLGRASVFGDTVTTGRCCWCHFDIDSGQKGKLELSVLFLTTCSIQPHLAPTSITHFSFAHFARSPFPTLLAFVKVVSDLQCTKG